MMTRSPACAAQFPFSSPRFLADSQQIVGLFRHFALQYFDKMPGGDKPTPVHQDAGYADPAVVAECPEMGNCVIW